MHDRNVATPRGCGSRSNFTGTRRFSLGGVGELPKGGVTAPPHVIEAADREIESGSSGMACLLHVSSGLSGRTLVVLITATTLTDHCGRSHCPVRSFVNSAPAGLKLSTVSAPKMVIQSFLNWIMHPLKPPNPSEVTLSNSDGGCPPVALTAKMDSRPTGT